MGTLKKCLISASLFFLIARQAAACFVFPNIDYWTCVLTPTPGQAAYPSSQYNVAYIIPNQYDVVTQGWMSNGGNNGYLQNVCNGTSSITPYVSVLFPTNNDAWGAMLDEFPNLSVLIATANVQNFNNFNLSSPYPNTKLNPTPVLAALCNTEYGSCTATPNFLTLQMNDNYTLNTSAIAGMFGGTGNSAINSYIANVATNPNFPGWSEWAGMATNPAFSNDYMGGCYGDGDLSVPGFFTGTLDSDTESLVESMDVTEKGWAVALEVLLTFLG